MVSIVCSTPGCRLAVFSYFSLQLCVRCRNPSRYFYKIHLEAKNKKVQDHWTISDVFIWQMRNKPYCDELRKMTEEKLYAHYRQKLIHILYTKIVNMQ